MEKRIEAGADWQFLSFEKIFWSFKSQLTLKWKIPKYKMLYHHVLQPPILLNFTEHAHKNDEIY